jgi:hypothetical protein
MKLRSLAVAPVFLSLAAGQKPGQKILLSQIDTLTLRSDQLTKGRRVAPIPQLKCVGGDGMGKYEVDVMRCRNVGRLVALILPQESMCAAYKNFLVTTMMNTLAGRVPLTCRGSSSWGLPMLFAKG